MFDIAKLPSAVRYEIWRKGCPKEKAYIHFSSKDIQTKYNTLDQVISKQSRQKFSYMCKAFFEVEDNSIEMQNAISQLNNTPEQLEYEKLQDQLQRQMLIHLKEDNFITLGFQKPRGVNDAPVALPLDVWNDYNPWSGNSFHIGKTTIDDVRLTLRSSVMEYLIEDTTLQSSSKDHLLTTVKVKEATKGRPSKKGIIQNAFDLGIEQGLIDCSQSNKTVFYKVEQIIKAEWPEEYEDGKGLGETPMRKYLTERLKNNRM